MDTEKVAQGLRLAVLVATLLTGCARDPLVRATYNALQQRECIATSPRLHCTEAETTYDDYAVERRRVLE